MWQVSNFVSVSAYRVHDVPYIARYTCSRLLDFRVEKSRVIRQVTFQVHESNHKDYIFGFERPILRWRRSSTIEMKLFCSFFSQFFHFLFFFYTSYYLPVLKMQNLLRNSFGKLESLTLNMSGSHINCYWFSTHFKLQYLTKKREFLAIHTRLWFIEEL